MDKEQKNNSAAEYEILGTKYFVTPVFKKDTSQKESFEDKIRRLILQDKQQKKGAKL